MYFVRSIRTHYSSDGFTIKMVGSATLGLKKTGVLLFIDLVASYHWMFIIMFNLISLTEMALSSYMASDLAACRTRQLYNPVMT